MNRTTADAAIKKAWMAGIISGVLTLIVTLAAMSGHSILGFSALNLADAALIFGLSFGIYKKSRTCAVIMLIYFIGSKIYLWKGTGSFAGLPLAALFGYYFYQGVAGTFDYHSNTDAPAAPAATGTPAPAPKFKTREEYEQWKAERLRVPRELPRSVMAPVRRQRKRNVHPSDGRSPLSLQRPRPLLFSFPDPARRCSAKSLLPKRLHGRSFLHRKGIFRS